MSVEYEAYLLLGTDPENITAEEDVLWDLKDNHNYAIHGNMFTGDIYFVGLKIPESDVLESSWYDNYHNLRKQVAEKLGCPEDLVDLSNGVLVM